MRVLSGSRSGGALAESCLAAIVEDRNVQSAQHVIESVLATEDGDRPGVAADAAEDCARIADLIDSPALLERSSLPVLRGFLARLDSVIDDAVVERIDWVPVRCVDGYEEWEEVTVRQRDPRGDAIIAIAAELERVIELAAKALAGLCPGRERRLSHYKRALVVPPDSLDLERARWLIATMGLARGTEGGRAIAVLARRGYPSTSVSISGTTSGSFRSGTTLRQRRARSSRAHRSSSTTWAP
jgi:hypothetical protein